MAEFEHPESTKNNTINTSLSWRQRFIDKLDEWNVDLIKSTTYYEAGYGDPNYVPIQDRIANRLGCGGMMAVGLGSSALALYGYNTENVPVFIAGIVPLTLQAMYIISGVAEY